MKNDGWGSGYQGRSRECMQSHGEGFWIITRMLIAIVSAILMVLQIASSLWLTGTLLVMSSVFFYASVVGFVLGIFVRSFYELGLVEVVWVLLVSFVVGLVWRRRSFALSAPHLFAISLFFLFLGLGLFRMNIATWSERNPLYEKQVGTEINLQGVVVREPDVRESSTHLYVQSEEELFLVTTDRFANISYGDELRIVGTLSKPVAFETDLGRTFDYAGYMQARGVTYTVRYAEITKTNEGMANPLIAFLLNLKEAFMQNIESVLREPQAGLSEGLLLGVKRALGEDLEEAFRTTGIIHIVVLSGYNIMLVVAFVMYVLAFVLPFKARLAFGFLAISTFAIIVGLTATVLRACIMASLVLFARATGRTYTVMRALMVAGAVMLLVNPYLLVFDTGFQLSFIATLGLILFAPIIEERLSLVPTAIGMREFLTATLATQLFVTPFLLYQIGEFSVVAVLVNLLVLPMVPIAMLLTFIAGCVAFFSTTLASVVAFFAYFSLSYIVFIAEFFAQLPFASFVVPAFPFFGVVIAYVVLGCWTYHLYRNETDAGEQILNGWTVEEETKVSGERSSPDTTTPVFFR